MNQNPKPPKNLTQKEYPYLPDAPTIITVGSYETNSPYHIGVGSEEEKYRVLAQIREMAIAFVADFSKQVEGKLDFRPESLSLVDEIIEGFKSDKQEDIEVFVGECGSYVGQVIRGQTLGKGKWHLSFPKYFFSGFRFPFKAKDKEGREGETIAETNPYAAVSKKLIALWRKDGEAEPSMKHYVSFIFQNIPK